MSRAGTVRRRAYLSLLYATIAGLTSAQNSETYYFSGAVQVSSASNQQGSYAVQAQCPADHPVSCSAIQEPNYCCPSNNYCTWSNSQVACCPTGQTCNGWGSGAGVNSWQPTTTSVWQPTSTWYPPATTTVYQGGGGGVVAPAGYQQTTTEYAQPQNTQTTQPYLYGGQYCSTLTANGPNLPTTAAGDCGTILVVAPSEAARLLLGWLKFGVMVVGLQMLGGLLLVWR